MLFDADTLGSVGVAFIVVITPGPDMALLTTHALLTDWTCQYRGGKMHRSQGVAS